MFILDIDPVGKPRMTQRDRWKKRSCVLRYRAFADKLRLICPKLDWENLSLTFGMKIPDSYSNIKKLKLIGYKHEIKPDLSNLIKSFEDVLLKNDSAVWSYGPMKKVWMKKGCIVIHSNVLNGKNN